MAGRKVTGRRAIFVVTVATSAWLLPTGSSWAQADTVYRWGGYMGSAGDVTFTQRAPTPAPGLSNVVALAAGNKSSYALEADGKEYAWGNGLDAQLGDGTPTAFRAYPDLSKPVAFPSGTVITGIAEANGYAVSVDSTGVAWAWGRSTRAGGRCLGKRPTALPHQVPHLPPVEAVAGASGHILFLTTDGSVYQCSRGLNAPALVTGLPAGIPATAVSAGNSFLSVLLADGEVWNWGLGDFGQLGDGAFSTSWSPVPVQLPPGTWATQIYAGGDDARDAHEMALLNTGEVVAWGANQFKQLGDGGATKQAVPVQVQVPNGIAVAFVAAGGDTSYVLDTGGNLWAWGGNSVGQVGNGTNHNVVFPAVEMDSGVSLISTTAGNVLDYHP